MLTGHLSLEEKVDGANMGFSLDFNKTIRVQNRSHWINSTDHVQFKGLDRWIAEHSQALMSILYRDEQYPERYLLYGEWVVATHSIHYETLPDRFLAFDLYDRLECAYVSRRILARLLDGKGICQVPLLVSCTAISRTKVMAYLEQTSAFSTQRIEGVYVRYEDEKRSKTVERGKIVRGDFISGNEHWSKGQIRFNGISVT